RAAPGWGVAIALAAHCCHNADSSADTATPRRPAHGPGDMGHRVPGGAPPPRCGSLVCGAPAIRARPRDGACEAIRCTHAAHGTARAGCLLDESARLGRRLPDESRTGTRM